ncbi:MAG: SMP-30/gluconolactonase/LRE family protein [Pseudomonadota bacterium]
MGRLLQIALAILLALGVYLVVAPTPVEPIAWQPSESQGYVGDFEANDALASAELNDLGGVHGPEDAAARVENGKTVLYVSSQEGKILRIEPATKSVSVFAETGGVPLGVEFDSEGNLIVADAYRGLLSVSPNGVVTTLTNEIGGEPIVYADDLDFGPDGVIYFSDASTKFGAEASGSTLDGSVLEILEHGRTGRLLTYDPATDETSVVADGFSFSNGVAIAPDGRSVLMNETGEYRVLRVYIAGARKGQAEVVIDGLPGFPDNINAGPPLDDGTPTFFLGLAGPRLPVIDDLAGRPFVRKMISRLPDFLKPAPVPYGFVMQFTEEGDVIRTWQDPNGAYPVTTGAIAPGDGYLYVTSLEAGELARVPFNQD